MSLRLFVPVLLALLVAGCGASSSGDGDTDDVRPKSSTAPSGPVIATLGDSIVAGSPHWDPDADVRRRLDGIDEDSQWQRWVDIDAELRNCGVWGERTDQIAERYDRCVDGAEGLVVQGGINDIVQGRPVTDAACDLAAMVDRGIEDGLPVALVELLPWNNGGEAAAVRIRELNTRIRAIAATRGVPVLPFHDVLADPDDGDAMRADLTVEGDHPTARGYRMLGERAWRAPAAGHPPTGPSATACAG